MDPISPSNDNVVSDFKATYFAGSAEEYQSALREAHRERNSMEEVFSYNSDAVSVDISTSNNAPVYGRGLETTPSSPAILPNVSSYEGYGAQQDGYTQDSVLNRFLSLKIETDEGDQVTLTSNLATFLREKDGALVSTHDNGSSVGVEVKGDLNDDELKQIDLLLTKAKSVASISERFSRGETSKEELYQAISDLESFDTLNGSLKDFSSKVETDLASGAVADYKNVYVGEQSYFSSYIKEYRGSTDDIGRRVGESEKTDDIDTSRGVYGYLEKEYENKMKLIDSLKDAGQESLKKSLLKQNFKSSLDFIAPFAKEDLVGKYLKILA